MDLKKWLTTGLGIVGSLIPGVSTGGSVIGLITRIIAAANAVEEATTKWKSGQAKEDAAFDIFKAMELTLDRDVLSDEAVQEAIREGFKAYVSFRNAEAQFHLAVTAAQKVIDDAKKNRG